MASNEQDPTFAIAYFQFDLADVEKQSTKQLWGSVNQQLASQFKGGDAQQDFSSKFHEAETPGVESRQTMLSPDIFSKFKCVLLVIDSVDDCEDLDNLLRDLRELSRNEKKPRNVVLSSQIEIDNSESSQCFNWTSLFLPFDIVKEDISAYISDRILDNPVLRDLHQYTQDKTKAILLKNAEEL